MSQGKGHWVLCSDGEWEFVLIWRVSVVGFGAESRTASIQSDDMMVDTRMQGNHFGPTQYRSRLALNTSHSMKRGH